MRLRTIAAALVVAAPLLVLESPSVAACWEGRGYGYAAAGYAAPRYGYMSYGYSSPPTTVATAAITVATVAMA